MTPMTQDGAQQPRLKFWQTRTARLGGTALILGLLLTFLPFHQVWWRKARRPLFKSGMRVPVI